MSTDTYKHQRRADLFLVRVWREDAEDGQDNAHEGVSGSDGSGKTKWCGRVQRVVDGESHQFSSWQGLTDLLLQMLSQSEGR